MRGAILNALQREVYRRCQQPANRFGPGCYDHIAAVVKHGVELARRYGGDEEIVAVAAWLHDIASVTDHSLYELHHEHGAEMAGDILTRMGYDREKIPLVQACIRSHRGSVPLGKSSIEEVCVADADAISHFDSVPGLLYLAYVQKGMGLYEGKAFVQRKLRRSFEKLSPEGRRYCREKYERAMEVLA